MCALGVCVCFYVREEKTKSSRCRSRKGHKASQTMMSVLSEYKKKDCRRRRRRRHLLPSTEREGEEKKKKKKVVIIIL